MYLNYFLHHQGESPLESLMKWRKRSQSDLDEDTVTECMSMEKEIQKTMSKSNSVSLCPCCCAIINSFIKVIILNPSVGQSATPFQDDEIRSIKNASDHEFSR